MTTRAQEEKKILKLAIIAALMLLIVFCVSAKAQTIAPTGTPVPPKSEQIAGSDGTNLRTIKTDNNGNMLVAPTASGSTSAGITPIVSTAAEGSHVLKASAGNLYSLYVTTGATAGFLMTFNATSAPVDGAVTPIECVQVPANSTVSVSFINGPPDVYSTGITAVFSSTGCFNKTVSATAFFKARVI